MNKVSTYLWDAAEHLETKEDIAEFVYENPQNPKDRWGLFFKGAIADGNPNIVAYTILAGIGGAAPWRSQDSFGLGYFYYGFSGAFKDTFRPILSLGDEQGVEMYYKAALTPWLNLTGDLQIISPAIAVIDPFMFKFDLLKVKFRDRKVRFELT